MAILVALEAIQNTLHFSKALKRFQQIEMKRLKSVLDQVQNKIKVDLSWPEIISFFPTSCEKKQKYIIEYNYFLQTKPLSKKKKKELENQKSISKKVL
jgi:hypothetical protein